MSQRETPPPLVHSTRERDEIEIRPEVEKITYRYMEISKVEFKKDYSDHVNFTGSMLYAEMDLNGKTISTLIMDEYGEFLFNGGKPDFDAVCQDLAEIAEEECADMLSLEELHSIYDTIPEEDEGNDRLNAAIEEFQEALGIKE